MKIPGWARIGGLLAVIGLGGGLLLPAALRASGAAAAPMPPRTAVNHAARECAQVLPGDECGDAILPAGWEYVDGDCPADYARVELRLQWSHFKAPFCCTEGHSGSRGDCEDVILQKDERRCAFVEDLGRCASLPPGWIALGKECPAGYEWVDDQACPVEGSDPAAARTAAVSPPAGGEADAPQPTAPAERSRGICAAPAPIVIAALAARRRALRNQSIH